MPDASHPTQLRRAGNRYGVRTKAEPLDLALRHLAGQPMTQHEALANCEAGSTT